MQKVLGLILELNPFHSGHMYFITEAKKRVKPDLTIAIISGNYTMRGEVSVIDKFTKTKLLLESEVDLILELPFLSTVNSADFFALNALTILAKFKITDLAFGVELDNLDKLMQMKDFIDSDLFNTLIKEKLSLGLSYSASSFKALCEQTMDKEILNNFSLPNNTLAIQYLRSIDKIKQKIKVHLIKRVNNNYYDKHTTKLFSSAQSLRVNLQEDRDISDFIPKFKSKVHYVNPTLIEDNIFKLIQYLFFNYDASQYSNLLGISEGIENRIANFVHKSKNYSELVNNIKTKRYTPNKIKRLLLHIIMNTSNTYQDKINYYLRLLGASTIGFDYINSLPKTTKSKIITSFKNSKKNELIDLELKATKVYGLLTNQTDIYLNEFKIPITGGK